MKHLLNNPIYNALISGNKDFANGNEQARSFFPTVAPFAGLKENAQVDFDSLCRMSPAGSFFILFVPDEMEIPAGWKIILEMRLLQMVYSRPAPPEAVEQHLVTLQEQQVPDMLALTKMTNPGPFLPETIKLGNYRGIFNGRQLVSMAGWRLQPKPYVEISAVCTHPDFLGKGYAGMLISDQVRRIIAGSGIPFLHVLEENATAIRLYQKLGFISRRKMVAYAIKKQEV